MQLQSKRKFCLCGGIIAHFRNRFSSVTIYTETGPISVEHLECRCKKCGKGFYYGYSTDSTEDDDTTKAKTKRQYKFYEEDCLECEVII